ncbi:AAA family ATPase [Microbacterium candidum]|uniref:AAA family ATPase n=1 Tax=Microbacterium candidum TaxID=3041922 RepID=A0ABT7MTG7_9MICO|nr:AAA family ATPase [Microbacterium sp. ASV49]MDL9977742.1 AAA family ATPase [Microbacterium sp. ASV49]
MLLSLTGASGSGKSTVLERLRAVRWGRPVECVEFDSIGVPSGADTAWRHGAIESWVQRALVAQDAGADLLLCGQVPIGELLAAPSADRLDGIAVCVLHCSPAVREARLRGRGDPEEALIHHVRFGEWFRGHALDPRHLPEVIRVETSVPMRWDRWDDWSMGDPRWAPRIIHTDGLTVGETADIVQAWARAALARRPSPLIGT